MQVSWSIICVSDAVQRIQNILADFLSTNACGDYGEPQVLPYWKVSGCSWINCEYISKKQAGGELERQVREVSGTEAFNILQQGDCIEYTSYVSNEEIIGNNEIAFVVCFFNMKENMR